MDIKPKKCCVRYDPPTLILYYEINSSGKLHRRSIPLRDVDFEETNETEILENLMKTPHHSKYIEEFNHDQLKRIVKKLVEKNGGLNINLNEPNDNEPTSPIKSRKILSTLDIENDDLNKLPDEDLNIVKNEMNETFTKNQVKPGDGEWKYDNEIEFNTGLGQIESSAWDDDDDDSDMEF